MSINPSNFFGTPQFVDSTPEYGVRTVGFHILLYINIIPKQHVRSPVTLNVTSGVVNALGCVLGISNICHRTGTGYADVRGCHGDELEPVIKKAVLNRLCAPSGARTLDPNIKSVVLYQLS